MTRRDAGGGDPFAPVVRPKLIDEFLPKVEELVEHSRGKIRVDKVHEGLVALGFVGTERTTRRAVTAAKEAYRAGRRHTYRPWVPEPVVTAVRLGRRPANRRQQDETGPGFAW